MKLKSIFLLASIALFSVWIFAGQHKRKTLPKVDNEAYKAKCGVCHFAYQPGLLPAESWRKIIDNQSAHPNLSFDPKAKKEIREYLARNSAENTRSKRSKKILRSIGGDAPTKISEIPYIRKKHREIRPEVFSGSAVKSRGNCVACHTTAESGDYDDDNVSIPE